MLSEAERLFKNEIYEKKQTARGVHGKTGKRGYVGKMLFPHELLSGAEKRKYKQNGKVVRWNMYVDIMDFDMFKKLNTEEQRKVLSSLRDNKTNQEIRKRWGLSSAGYYAIVNRLSLKTKRHGIGKERLSEHELLEHMRTIMTYEDLGKLAYEQQHFLFNHYLKSESISELSKIWMVKYNTVYSYKTKLETKLKNGEFEVYTLSESPEIDEIKEVDQPKTEGENHETQISMPNDSIQDELLPVHADTDLQSLPILVEEKLGVCSDTRFTDEKEHDTTLSFEGQYTQEQLRKKLNALVELLESDGRYYKMNISFTEIPEPSI